MSAASYFLYFLISDRLRNWCKRKRLAFTARAVGVVVAVEIEAVIVVDVAILRNEADLRLVVEAIVGAVEVVVDLRTANEVAIAVVVVGEIVVCFM